MPATARSRTRAASPPAATAPTRPASRFPLLAILALALLVRVVYVLQSRSSPTFAQPAMDALYHLQWARAFAAGEDFQPGPFFRAPLYPWFLGLLIRVFGEDLLLIRLLQAGIGTASVGLVHLVGTRVFDRRTGLVAALLASIYWVTIYFEGELLLPVLEIFFDLLAIWLSLRIAPRPTPGRAALAGAAWGVAALVRPNVLLFAPFVLAWVFWQARKAGRPLLAPLAFAVALGAPIAPIAVYNRVVGGDWVLISSQGGVNFWIGNNPRSNGQTAIVPGTRADWWGGYHDSIAMAQREAGRKLSPAEVSRHYNAKAWAWIRSEPRAALAHALWKLRLFFTDHELANNATESFFAFRFGPILRWLPLGFGVLAPLALLGWVLSAPRSGRILPLWGFVPVYTASVVAFFVCSRFRVPVLPVMAVFAAHAAWRMVEMARGRRFVPLLASIACLAISFGIVRSVPASVDQTDASGLWELGVLAAQRGDLPQAVDHFRESIARNDRYSMPHQDLGIALRKLGRTEEAERSLRRAVEIDPDNVVALSTLFDLLFTAGRREEARAVARQAAVSSPVYAPARYDLGRLAFFEAEDMERKGEPLLDVRARLEQALGELRSCLDLSRDDPASAFNCAYAAGRVLLKLGRPAEASEAFLRALEVRPQPGPRDGPGDGPGDGSDADVWWWQCQYDLARSLEAAGRGDEARARKEDLRRRYPDDPRPRKL